MRRLKASAVSPVPMITMKRVFMPRARATRKARRIASRRASVTTTWAGKRMSRKARLTSGSLRMKRALKVAMAMIRPALTTSTASARMDHRTRLR
jgi:hypothetical protein